MQTISNLATKFKGETSTLQSRSATGPTIAVVIPAYRVAAFIEGVIARVPLEVNHIIVVDDASPDGLQDVLKHMNDHRLIVLRHETNRGVGGAMKTGFQKALELEADLIVKIDGDGQMDPGLLSKFASPILDGQADMTKGNRFVHLSFIRKIPVVRRLGNLALSFLVKLASGYWRVFDPCNGYIALRGSFLKKLDLDRVADGYFFEISLLCEAYFGQGVLRDVPMQPVYGEEVSSLNPLKEMNRFAPRLLGRSMYRFFMSYFMRDFNMVSLFLVTGLPALSFGVVWSLYYWVQTLQSHVATTTGTIMIGVLPIVLGFQLVLQALVLDVENEPGRNQFEPNRSSPNSVNE